jgi:hypothetical protein
MKKFISRSVTTVALVSMLGVAAPAVAFAGSVKASTHTSTSITAKNHEALMDVYRASALAIRNTFKASVTAAKTTFKAARAAATTSIARDAARTAFRTSMTTAVSVRKAAFKALGAPPVKK